MFFCDFCGSSRWSGGLRDAATFFISLVVRGLRRPLLRVCRQRQLQRRPGYEIDIERVSTHAKQNGCFFELNSSPDRLDVSAENARLIREAGILIAISTDAHSTGELATIRFGLEQARRAALDKYSVLNTRPLPELLKLFAR